MRQGEPAQVLEVFGDDHVVNGLIALGWPPPAGPGFPQVATELGVGRAVRGGVSACGPGRHGSPAPLAGRLCRSPRRWRRWHSVLPKGKRLSRRVGVHVVDADLQFDGPSAPGRKARRPADGCVPVNHRDVGDQLAPGQPVPVVLEGPGEHDGRCPAEDSPRWKLSSRLEGILSQRMPTSLPIAIVLPSRRRVTTVVLVPADRIACDCARVVTLPGGLQAAAVGPSVDVGLPGEHLIANEVVDEGQRPARGVYPA
jgi:hypothetical protein